MYTKNKNLRSLNPLLKSRPEKTLQALRYKVMVMKT